MAMPLGAEPKKVALLAALLAVAGALLYINVFSPAGEGGSAALPPVAPSLAPTPAASGEPRATVSAPAVRAPLTRAGRTEFRPSLRRPAEEATTGTEAAPFLQLDLLEKLRAVQLAGTGRNLFEFGPAPPPPPPPNEAKPEPKIVPRPVMTPVEPTPPPVEVERKPKAPPIPLKFFGYTSPPRGGPRRGFFLDGEEIVVVSEGEMIQKRYQVIRIGPASAELEDLQFQDRQTLRLEEPPGGGGA